MEVVTANLSDRKKTCDIVTLVYIVRDYLCTQHSIGYAGKYKEGCASPFRTHYFEIMLLAFHIYIF